MFISIVPCSPVACAGNAIARCDSVIKEMHHHHDVAARPWTAGVSPAEKDLSMPDLGTLYPAVCCLAENNINTGKSLYTLACHLEYVKL